MCKHGEIKTGVPTITLERASSTTILKMYRLSFAKCKYVVYIAIINYPQRLSLTDDTK